uniref:Uncharacterized protein n=1 Tax=Molossus molossus TaxID=27622 RepID=A0A7J8JVX9_MOLMO|nr:hypothetical protein HJG59_008049 [Molossus molossus]
MAQCIRSGQQQQKYKMPTLPLLQTTTALELAAYKTMAMSGHPPVPCPPSLPLSAWMSCHLSMKECQAFSPSDWQFLLFRFSGCFKRVAMCYRKDYPPQQAVFQASTPSESPASFYHVQGDL